MKSNSMRSLLTVAIQYAMGGLVARALAVISVPLYLHLARTEDLGIQALALVSEQVLLILAGYALTNAVGKFYWDAVHDGKPPDTVIATACIAITPVALGVFVIWELFATPLSAIILDSSVTSQTITRLIGLSFFANVYSSLALNIWQASGRAVLYSAFGLAKQLLITGCSLIFLAMFSSGAIALVSGWAVASVLTGLFATVCLLRAYGLQFDTRAHVSMWQYGLPMVPAALAMVALNGADRYLLKAIVGFEAVGIYSVIIMVAAALNLVLVTPFKQAWARAMWQLRHSAHELWFHQRTLTYYLTVQAFALCGTLAFADLAVRLFSGGRPEFVAAAYGVPIVFTGYVLSGTYDIVGAGYFFAAKTIFYTVSVICSTAMSVLLNALLIPLLGLIGSCIAFALAYVVFASLSFIFGRRYFAVPYEWSRIGRLIGAGIVVGTSAVWARSFDGITGIMTAFAALATFPLLLVATSFFDDSELAWLKAQLRAWRARLRPA